MGIRDWLRTIRDRTDGNRLRRELRAAQQGLGEYRNQIYEMVTGDAPTISNIRKNGHEEALQNLDNALHGAYISGSFGGRPEKTYSVNQKLPSGGTRVVVSKLPHEFDAMLIYNLLVILDKVGADYDFIEER